MRKMKTWGQSIRGPGHIAKGLPNQDAYLIRRLSGNAMICIVSDGLGSKPLSHIGSRAACRAVVKAIKAMRKNKEMQTKDLFALIHAFWLTEILPHKAVDCGATCLFAYINKDKVFAATLGDGMILLDGKEPANAHILSDDKENNFSNTTSALSIHHNNSVWKWYQMDRQGLSAILLCTDGISSDLMEGKERDFLHELKSTQKPYSWQNKKEARNWISNWPVKGHSDDKTLIYLEVIQ